MAGSVIYATHLVFDVNITGSVNLITGGDPIQILSGDDRISIVSGDSLDFGTAVLDFFGRGPVPVRGPIYVTNVSNGPVIVVVTGDFRNDIVPLFGRTTGDLKPPPANAFRLDRSGDMMVGYLGLKFLAPSTGIKQTTIIFRATDVEPSALQPPAGMVSWWPGDGNANDIVDGNPGALTGDATFAPGMVGKGFSLDGTGDFVLVADSANLNITGDVTVDLWAMRTVSGDVDDDAMITKGRYGFPNTADERIAYTMYFTIEDTLWVGFSRADGERVSMIGPTVTDSSFHHYAYVRSGNTHKLFMDGVVVASGTFTGSAEDTTGLPLTIGAGRYDPALSGFGSPFNGVIDEVEVFNRALSDAEVKAIYDVGSTGKVKTRARIVFPSARDGNEEIYVMDADGSNQIRLTNNPALDDSPVWSPDGRKLAFRSERGGNSDIYLMDPVDTDGDGNGDNLVRLTTRSSIEHSPTWSPDGRKIAFNSNRDGNWEVYVMDADGSNPARLTNNPATDEEPAWSPDGNKIAFPSDRGGNREIWVMGADGSNPTNLTNHPAWDDLPAWSPDASKLTFFSNRDGNPEIYVMNADGSNQTRLTISPAVEYDSAWSRDGSKIAFDSNRTGNFEVWVMNADGSNPVNLTNNPALDASPDWSPGIVP